MLFPSSAVLSLLSLSTITFAAPLNTRSTAATNIYETCTNRVNYELGILSKLLDAIVRERPEGRSLAASRITEQTNHVLHASKDGASTMRDAAPASIMEATALTGPLNSLTQSTDAVTKQWIKIKDIVFQMNGQQKVIGILRNMKDAAAEFTVVMNSKMPNALYKQAGQVYGNTVDQMVSEVIKQYSAPPRGSTSPGWF